MEALLYFFAHCEFAKMKTNLLFFPCVQVDFMLGSYMEDIGITSDQFEAACGKASSKIRTQFHQALFEQAENR